MVNITDETSVDRHITAVGGPFDVGAGRPPGALAE